MDGLRFGYLEKCGRVSKNEIDIALDAAWFVKLAERVSKKGILIA
jgi:hypothetical protein